MIKKILVSIYLFLLVPNVISADGITNPLKVNNVPDLIGIVIKALLGVVGSIALLMFIYGGFLWLTSGGNSEKIKNGKQTIIWAVLGLVLIFSAYTILNQIFTTLAK